MFGKIQHLVYIFTRLFFKLHTFIFSVAFRLYDVNDDGMIDKTDLMKITSAVVTSNFSRKTVATLIDKVMSEVYMIIIYMALFEN